jgi:2-oxoglutarate dehydrogenase E2 component (dihydrolipoamide succinyltransferase)
VEVETDKANAEVQATEAGTVSRLLAQPGDVVDVGEPIAEFGGDVSGSAAAPAPVAAAPAPPVQAPPAPAAPAAPAPPAPPAAPAPPPPPPAGPVAAGPPTPAVTADAVPWNAGGIVAAPTPSALGSLPLSNRPGAPRSAAAPPPPSAPPSRASRSDAGAAAVAAAGLPVGTPAGMKYYKPPKVKAEAGDTVIPFNKRRGIISEHMVYSKHVSPHVPCFAEVDMTAVWNLRKAHKDRYKQQGISLTVLSFVLKATTQALREYPGVNAVVGDGEIIERGAVNLGVAVETDGGLVVPVIRDADTLSVGGLANAVVDMATRARDKKITVDDLTGGTFTVSNPGRRGNLFGAAIINQPQVGILRMGEIVRRPVVRMKDGEEVICIRSMMFLSLSYDHRVIDGVKGNGFLYRVRELLEAGNFEL